MHPTTPSVFDSLVEPEHLPAGDAVLAGWLIGRLLRMGDANGLKQLVEDLRAQGMGDALDSWLGSGPARAVDAAKLAGLVRPGRLFDDTELTALAGQSQVGREELLQRFAQLLPDLVKTLMPRGEVPSWRALELGLSGLQRSLRAGASAAQAR